MKVNRVLQFLAFLILLYSCQTAPLGIAPVAEGYRIPADFRIVGYFPSWSGNPEIVQYRALTHINYAFVQPQSDGQLAPVENPEKLRQLRHLSARYGVKLLISLGGGTTNDTLALENVTKDPVLMSQFLVNLEAFVEEFDLDGVDVDWEYPTVASRDSYTLLITALSDMMKSGGRLLTAAVSPGPLGAQGVSDEALINFDFINVMAYDDGYKQQHIAHSSYRLAKKSMEYWTNVRGVPSDQVILGLPFYGRDLETWKAKTFKTLMEKDNQVWNSSRYATMSYNNADMIKAKAVNLARRQGGGVMIWQIAQDSSGQYSLLNALFDAIKTPIDEEF